VSKQISRTIATGEIGLSASLLSGESFTYEDSVNTLNFQSDFDGQDERAIGEIRG